MNGSYNPDVYAEGELAVRATAEDSSVVQHPKRTFLGSGELNFVKLGEIAKIYSGGTPSRRNYGYWNGNIPWVKTTQIQSRIIFEADIDEYITEEGLKRSSAKVAPQGTILMAMYGQGKTRGRVGLLGINAAINQACCAIEPYEEISSEYVFQYLVFSYTKIRELSNDGSQKNLNAGIVKNLKIFLPPLPEQKEIANVLQACDATIEKAEALIAVKERQFDWLISSCINKSGYEKSQLSNLTSEVSKRNGDRSIERVLSVTNHSGFVLPENQFERRVASANLSNYKIVSKGEYAYNPSRINVGSIARLDNWDIGVLSPMYVVFELDSMKIDSDYFLHWLSSSEARQRIKNSAQGSVRETVGFSDLGAVPIALPNIETQKRIAHTLNTARQEIETLKTLVDRYRTQKRGLMQKLLTGKWRVGL